MRVTVTAMAVMTVLALSQPSFAQGTTAPTVQPRPQQGPVVRRQPRPTDVTPLPPERPAPRVQTENDPDEKLNRALNSICRGC
jgi:hypothetical protein